MVLDFLVSLGIFFSGSVLIDGFTFLSNISDYSGYVTGCFNDIINYFSGFFRGTPPVEVDVIINGETILENGNLENSNLMYGNENLMLENQDTINLIYGNENLMLENQDTVNLTVGDQENVNLTVENQDTVNLTVEDQENVNLTVENQDTVNLTVENQDTENSVISSLINKGGGVYDTRDDIMKSYSLFRSSGYSCYNVSYYQHGSSNILSEESINLKAAEFKDKPAKCVRLPDFCSFKGFSERKIKFFINGIYKNEQPLLKVFGKGQYNNVNKFLFKNFSCTFNDENTVKYVKENLGLFKVYTHLPFRLGMLLEGAELDRDRLDRNRLESGNLRDLKGHVAMCHTLDVCTALSKSIYEKPEVSFRNFVNLYENDEEFEKLVIDLNDPDLNGRLLTEVGSLTNHMDISYSAEVLNCILDKVYKKNNGTDNN